ncbi:MAG: efflux RND transporter permease subunit [Planctomycetota bacterium]
MLSRFFIDRPIFATVISLVIVLAGVVAQQALPVAKFPEVAPPTVAVTARYPGANAMVVAETVAALIEQEVNGVEDMLYMSSVSGNDGSYTLTVTFEIGADMDMSQVLVQNRVAIANPRLPEEVRRQGIITKKQSTQIVQFVTLTSEAGQFDALFLHNYATLRIRDELTRIPGVGEVTVFGVGEYGMRIWLDPQLLKARNLTTDEVVAAIREQNVQVAAGQVGGPPTPDDTAFQYTINAMGRLRDVEQFENLIVRTAEGGRITRVRDVARVELGSQMYRFEATSNGLPCAALAIYQLPGANALEVAEGVKATMARLADAFPQGVRYDIPFDTTRFVTASIAEVYTTLIVAVLLVVLVIFIFLQDWRATLIPCAAIPVSLVGTFAMMAAVGFSINMLTLFGIVLAIGIVVDDAIVVVENTFRHLDAGMTPKEAAKAAMAEITGPVIATTLVLLAVFVPTAFMGGITGQLYRQFALTISGAVIISTINALTLSPALCGILLRPSGENRLQRFFFFRWFNWGFDAATRGYAATVGAMVRRVALVMLVFVGLVVLTAWGFVRLPTGFLPTEDQGYCFANVQLPDAASLPRTARVMKRFDEIVRGTPGVADWITISGYSLLSGTAGSNVGLMAIVFDPWEERTTPELRQEAILAKLRRQFAAVEEAIGVAFIPPAIDGLGVAGGFQMQLQDRGDLGPAALEAMAMEVVADGNAQTGLTALTTPFRASVPQLFIDVDRDKVKTLGVPLASVFGTLQAYLGSAYVNDFTRLGRTYQVLVQADEQFRVEADDIRRLEVRNNQGQMVPLGTLLTISDDFGPQMLQRYNLFPSAQINGEAAPGFSSGQALSLMEQMARAKLPPSMGYQWTGMSFQEQRVGNEQYLIFVLAVVCVFLVLAAQYESWTNPAAVIAVVPLAALGVVIALWMSGLDNNVYTQIGVVLLVALASKNAILIVEFAAERQRQGLSLREAARSAAELRFRAILMTAFSSILGFLPLVVAAGAGAASRQSVGTVVVGGMIAATIFSLLFVPSFFVLFAGLAGRGTKSQAPLEPRSSQAP